MMEVETKGNDCCEDRPVEKISPIPNGSHICESSFTTREEEWKEEREALTGDENPDVRTKKRVNIKTDGEETTSDQSAPSDKCLTMTGTIKRGKKAGQSLDVKLNISREELEVMEANITAKESNKKLLFNLQSGPHITLFTLLTFPIAFLISSIYSFYIGTLTWYSIFTYFSEDRNIFYKITLPPLLLVIFPFFIILCTFGLGIYSAFVQLSWHLGEWSKEFFDWEKGFYGWMCSIINLEECSPYEVIVLMDIKGSTEGKASSQDSILTT